MDSVYRLYNITEIDKIIAYVYVLSMRNLKAVFCDLILKIADNTDRSGLLNLNGVTHFYNTINNRSAYHH